MSDRNYFAYIRVSTPKQGQRGTSLDEQRSAIEKYSRKNGLRIIKEFQEQETAAKRGRPVFRQMMQALQQGKAAGLVMHKIDRGARNLKDWGEIGDLIDLGVEVHFANENLDMYTRGGRLSADIQAVVAADYIRNLREEVKKGMYGRIKQGLYPMPAPIGYLDQGSGRPKIPDPAKAPIIKELFELYSSRRFSLHRFVMYARNIGLRRRTGFPLSVNGMSNLLHNHFYTGIIWVKKANEFYQGRQEAIISKSLFDRVQEVLYNNRTRLRKHSPLKEKFVYRGFLKCGSCGAKMYAELQKHHNYYRCHTKGCASKSIREEVIQSSFMAILLRLRFDRFKTNLYKNWILERRNSLEQSITQKRAKLRTKLESIREVLNEMTEAMSGSIAEWPAFVEKKNKLVEEQLRLREQIHEVEYSEHAAMIDQERAFDFAPRAYLTFRSASYDTRREVIAAVAESITVISGRVEIKLNTSYENLLKI